MFDIKIRVISLISEMSVKKLFRLDSYIVPKCFVPL